MENKLTQIEEQLKKIKEQTSEMFRRIAEEGVTTKEGKVLIPPTVSPTAGELEETTETPEVEYQGMDKETAKAISKIGAGAVSATEITQKQYEDWQKQQAEFMKALGEAGVETKGKSPWQAMIDFVTKKPKIETEAKLKEAWEEFKVPEWLSKVQQQSVKVAKLQGEMDKLDIERLNELTRLEQQMIGTGATMRFLRGEKGELNRQYDIKKAYMAAELGAEAALLQAYSGNLDLARSMANDVVQAYKFDAQQKREDFDILFNVYGSWIDSLDQEKKTILEKARQDAIREEQKIETEKTQIMDWMITYPDAGITIDDTLEEAAEKAKRAEAAKPEKEEVKTQYRREWEEAGGETGTGMTLSQWIQYRTGIAEVTPRDWTDSELDAAFRAIQTAGGNYQKALDEIALDPTIRNKEYARQKAAEFFGIAPTEPTEEPYSPEKARKKAQEEGKMGYISAEGQFVPLTLLPEITSPLFE